jgi:hypothetical protein
VEPAAKKAQCTAAFEDQHLVYGLSTLTCQTDHMLELADDAGAHKRKHTRKLIAHLKNKMHTQRCAYANRHCQTLYANRRMCSHAPTETCRFNHAHPHTHVHTKRGACMHTNMRTSTRKHEHTETRARANMHMLAHINMHTPTHTQ